MRSTKLSAIFLHSVTLCFISVQVWLIKDEVLQHQNIMNTTNTSSSIEPQSVELISDDNFHLLIGLQINSIPENTQKAFELYDMTASTSNPKMTLWISENEFDLTYITDGNYVERFVVSVSYSLNERIALSIIKNTTTTTFEVQEESRSKSLSETIGDLQLQKCDAQNRWCLNTDVYNFSLL